MDAMPMIGGCMRLQVNMPVCTHYAEEWTRDLLVDTGEARRPFLMINVDASNEEIMEAIRWRESLSASSLII